MGAVSRVWIGRWPLLARSRELPLTQKGLVGPLLIPSVSSKGFPEVDGMSEAGAALHIVSQDMTDSLLISAYDLHYGLLPDHSDLLSDKHSSTLYVHPALLVVDSGGYETSDSYESGETRRGPREVREFDRRAFESVADALPTDRELLVVTYDGPDVLRTTFEEQREVAQRFKADRPHLKVNLLLKPPEGQRFVKPDMVASEVRNLRIFDVIGVTEKELGDNVLERLVALARLRQLFDDNGCDSVPIHVFGCLDPLLTPLYFMSGGEIFDGLSWLRYGYYEDCSIHPEELALLAGSIEADQVRRDAYRYIRNLQELQKLKRNLERWVNDPSRYDVLGRHHERIREIHETVEARVKRRV